jgi:hypothetical protein
MTHSKLKDSQINGAVPIGGIIMWAGLIADIPTPDWQLCNGTLNSPGPDLRDKFIVGAKEDNAGVAKTNVEGTLLQSGGTTAHSHPFTISDHTGLTHDLTIANHADITHAALASHPTTTTSIASHPTTSIAGLTHSAFRTINSSVGNAGALATLVTGSVALASHPTQQQAGATHANISLPGVTHAGIGTHLGSVYGVHSITAPAGHGTAGTVTHAFSETSMSQVPTYFALAFIQRML